VCGGGDDDVEVPHLLVLGRVVLTNCHICALRNLGLQAVPGQLSRQPSYRTSIQHLTSTSTAALYIHDSSVIYKRYTTILTFQFSILNFQSTIFV
jgi:hypothetical protein